MDPSRRRSVIVMIILLIGLVAGIVGARLANGAPVPGAGPDVVITAPAGRR